jgi:hypothetical protein
MMQEKRVFTGEVRGLGFRWVILDFEVKRIGITNPKSTISNHQSNGLVSQ